MCVRLNERPETKMTLRILALVPKFLRIGNTRGEQTLLKRGLLLIPFWMFHLAPRTSKWNGQLNCGAGVQRNVA